jgi:hypothetical protein
MKPILRQHNLLALLAASCVGMAFAADLPVSRTGGSVNVSLPVGQTTMMSLPLVEIVASGTVASTGGGNTITLSSSPASLPNVLTDPHAIKITSRDNQAGGSTNAYGFSAQITAQATQTVTAALAVTPNVGDEFIIYRLETIGSIFGATNSVGLLGGGSAGASDIVYLEDGGVLTGYFYKTTALGGTGWRLATNSGSPNQGNVVVKPNRGVLVIRKAGGSAVSINFTGEAMVGNEKPVVISGFNLISNPFGKSTTLRDSFLKDFVTGGGNAGAADLVYLESAGVLTAYFYKNTTLGGTGWRIAGTTTSADNVTIAAAKAILFKEQNGSVSFTLPEPFAK